MKTCKRISRVSFGLLFLVTFVSGDVKGQGRVDAYTQTSFTATWTDIQTTGIPVDAFGVRDDFTAATIPLPFDFPYDGTIVPAGPIHVGVDGGISLINAYLPNDPNAGNDDDPIQESNTWPPLSVGDSTYPGLICFFM